MPATTRTARPSRAVREARKAQVIVNPYDVLPVVLPAAEVIAAATPEARPVVATGRSEAQLAAGQKAAATRRANLEARGIVVGPAAPRSAPLDPEARRAMHLAAGAKAAATRRANLAAAAAAVAVEV